MDLNLGNMFCLSDARTRSISPENFTGDPGGGWRALEGTGAFASHGLGQGWKISPSYKIAAEENRVLADIQGAGVIQHIWMTVTGNWRHSILRIYWDDAENPAVECPVGDFIACGWNRYTQISSLAICVNPGSAFNSYWHMPFRSRCKITLTNTADKEFYI